MLHYVALALAALAVVLQTFFGVRPSSERALALGPSKKFSERARPLWGDAGRLERALRAEWERAGEACLPAESVGVRLDVVAWRGETRFDPTMHVESGTRVDWRDPRTGRVVQAASWAVWSWKDAAGAVVVRRVEMEEARCMGARA